MVFELFSPGAGGGLLTSHSPLSSHKESSTIESKPMEYGPRMYIDSGSGPTVRKSEGKKKSQDFNRALEGNGP